MAAPRWLLLAGLAALAAGEFPDLTLVLQPDEDLDWNQITRWMEQSRFSVDAESQHHASGQTPEPQPVASALRAPPRPGPTDPGHSGHSGHTQSEQSVSDPAAEPAAPAASIGPALTPGAPPVVPGPALVPGAPPVVPAPAFSPAWPRPVRPGPPLMPGAAKPSPLPKWRPQWPELRPGPPLMPRPAPLAANDDPTAKWRQMQRGEPLLPAGAPGAHQVEPTADPPPAAATTGPDTSPVPAPIQSPDAPFVPTPVPAPLPTAGPAAAAAEPRLAGIVPAPAETTVTTNPVVSADFQDLRPPPGLLPPDERDRYQAPRIDDYDQQSPPAQLNLARPPPPLSAQSQRQQQPQPQQQQQRQQHQEEADYQGLPLTGQQPPPTEPPPTVHAPQPDARSSRQLVDRTDFQARPSQSPADYTGQSARTRQEYRDLLPGQRLLALEESPAVIEQQVEPTAAPAPRGGTAVQMPPDALAVLLQRLEERLVASETQQQQLGTQLRAIQHSQRKAEVVAREDMVAVRGEFRDMDTKMDNLQFDLGRATSLLEAVMSDVQKAQRALREQAALLPSRGAAGKQLQLQQTVDELSRKLGQLVVNTEMLKGGQRRLGGNVRAIENRTSELSERSEEFATKVSLANSLSEMRNYLERQKRVTAAPPSKEDAALPGDCSDVLLSGEAGRQSGIYQVRPRGALQPIFVYCDQQTDGGGWAVIQRRVNGDEDFFRDWLAYKYGFGNLGGEFWLGNENIHLLTNHRLNELRVDLSDFPRERPGYETYPGSNATAKYGAFALGSETEGYSLRILDNYSGDAGDSLKYHAGMKFSTKDMDNDLWKEDSCAANHKGGWWYKGCDSSNLNGLYLSGPVPSEYEYQVAYWFDWRGALYSLYRTQMMVRPANHLQRLAEPRRRGSGRRPEDGKTAAQRRSSTQTVRGRNRRRRQRRRKGRRHGH